MTETGRGDDDAGTAALQAIVLAGGRGRRLGGRDKPALTVAGRTLLERVVSAAGDAERIVVVGPERPGLRTGDHPTRDLRFVREETPGSGPVDAVRAGLDAVSAPWVAVLAADLPFLRPEHLRALLSAARSTHDRPEYRGPVGDHRYDSHAAPGHGTRDRPSLATRTGAVLIDGTGRPQWLIGVWRVTALRAALGRYAGDSLRGLFTPLRPYPLWIAARRGEPPPWLDCDTPDDVNRAREWSRRRDVP